MSVSSKDSKPKIHLAKEGDYEKWDSYISTSPEAGPYHKFGWKKAVENGYRHKGYYLMAEDERGECVGVLPLICLKFPWGRKTLVSLPYCDYAGPLGDPEVKKALVDESLSLAQRLRVKTVELRCSQQQQWMGEDLKMNVQNFSQKVRMLLQLPSGSSDLWSEFKPKLRSQIRRPQKEGLKAKIGGQELLDDFYRIFTINMYRLGSPVHHRRWFVSLLDGYGDQARVGVVYHKMCIPVAAGIILASGSKACVPWASALKEYNPLAPNMLLYYQFLTWAIDHEHIEFDFGRSTPGEGTYKFKEQWGSSPQSLHWYKPNFKRMKHTGIISKSSSRNTIANVWSRVPIWMVTLIGPKIRKYISL